VATPTWTLGSTGVEVSALYYGAMELRGVPRGPAIEDADAGRLLNAVLDEGITLIDASIDYGRSEELIGRYLSSRRDKYFLASKCGCLPSTPADARPTGTTTRPPTSGPEWSRASAACRPIIWTWCSCTCRRRASSCSLDHLRGNVATASRGPLAADIYAEAVRRLNAESRALTHDA
jgi:hypothetical protein